MSTSDQVFEGIPVSIATGLLAGLSLAVACAGFMSALAFLRYIDLPFCCICFMGNAWLSMNDEKRSEWALMGMFGSLIACLIAAGVLFFDRDHPWVS